MRLPVIYRSENDDSAPIDYSYVASVSEGVRNRQNAPIHEADAPAHRRADPNAHNAISDATSAPTERASGPRGYEAARRMPRAGDTPAPARIAYPRPRSNDFAAPSAYEPTAPQTLDEAAQVRAARADFSRAQSPAPAAREAVRGVADEWGNLPDATLARQSFPNAQGRAPFADVQSRAESRQTASAPRQAPFDNVRAAESAMPRRAIGEARQAPEQAAVQPTDVFTADGSQYAAPAKAEVPDWLKTAQQNNAPMSEEFRRRRSPQVQRAPRQAAQPAPMERDMLGRPVRRVAAQAPRAPQSPYEEAGYPPELIAMHRDEERERAEWGARKRHGAQYAQQAPQAGPSARRMPPQAGAPAQRMPSAAPSPDAYAQAPHRREDYAPQGFDRAYRRDDRAPTDAPSTDELYGDGSAQAANRRRSSPANDGGYERRRPAQQGDDPREGRWQDDESDAAPMAKDKPPKPILAVALFLAAAVLVALWIMQITFTDERETILADRAEVAASYSASHPYRYRDVIEAAAEANNLHPAFVAAIVLNESSFNPSAESDVGARGLMQMMPETAKWVHDKIDTGTEYSFDLMWDAETNVKYACWYLAYLSERFSNDPILVSAAFHAGQTTVQNWLNDSRYSADNRSITLENMVDGPTKSYAARVTKAFAVYRRLYYEATETTSVIASDPLASLIASTVRSVKGMIEGGLHAESDVASEAVDASSETLAASSEALSASNSRKRRARRI